MAVDLTKLAQLGHIQDLAIRIKNAVDKISTAELEIDDAKTDFINSFVFDTSIYSGVSNPNLDGKTVLVLAFKVTDNQGSVSTRYKFINLEDFIPEIKISSVDGNAINAKNDGVYATTRVAGAIRGNVAIFDTQGSPSNSDIASDKILLSDFIATDEEAKEIFDTIFPKSD